MLRYDDPLSLARLFHLNSEPWNNLAAYEDPHARVVEFKTVGAPKDRVALPAADPSPLTRLIAERRSCREFEARDVSAAALSAVLETAYGVTGFRGGPDGRMFGRAVPSGGGRYPLELYILADHVAGVSRGLYHFHSRDHALEPLSDTRSIADVIPDLMNQRYLENAAALIFIAAVFPRTLYKYAARGYRYVLIEAGHAAQNACLRAVELGLGSLCVGGFADHRINALLKLDERVEGVVYGVAMGHIERSAAQDSAKRHTGSTPTA